MSQKTTSRLRELLKELQQAQHESGDLARRAKHGLAGVIQGTDLKPVGTSGHALRKKKAGRKKR